MEHIETEARRALSGELRSGWASRLNTHNNLPRLVLDYEEGVHTKALSYLSHVAADVLAYFRSSLYQIAPAISHIAVDDSLWDPSLISVSHMMKGFPSTELAAT
jgi:hypothetical protein